MRWITVGPADQPGTSIVPQPPAVDAGLTERRTTAQMTAKGGRAAIILATLRPRRHLRAAAGQRR